MPKFSINFSTIQQWNIEIEADTPEAALELAKEIGDTSDAEKIGDWEADYFELADNSEE